MLTLISYSLYRFCRLKAGKPALIAMYKDRKWEATKSCYFQNSEPIYFRKTSKKRGNRTPSNTHLERVRVGTPTIQIHVSMKKSDLGFWIGLVSVLDLAAPNASVLILDFGFCKFCQSLDFVRSADLGVSCQSSFIEREPCGRKTCKDMAFELECTHV